MNSATIISYLTPNSVFDRFHEIVVGVQIHTVVLQSIEPMNDVRATSIDVAVSVLILDIVIDIRLVPEKICQVRGRHVQPSSRLAFRPLKAVRVEVLVYTVIL